MKRFGFVCTLADFGFAAFVWLIPGTAPASLDRTTVSQVNIQGKLDRGTRTACPTPLWSNHSERDLILICGWPIFLMEELMERVLFQEVATPQTFTNTTSGLAG